MGTEPQRITVPLISNGHRIRMARKLTPLPRPLPGSPERSRNMSAIRSKGNKSTELRMIKILRQYRLSGWRRNSEIYGHPDFVFPEAKLAIFIDGCFWHGCPKCYRKPKTNIQYWVEKIRRNVVRDRQVSRLLRQTGWSVIRIWEHSLGSPASVAKRILRMLSKSNNYMNIL